MFVRGGHTNSREKTRSERQRRKGKIYQLNAEFQRLARRDKNTFFSEKCKETEENKTIGKTDLFKKIRDIKGTFHVMGSTVILTISMIPIHEHCISSVCAIYGFLHQCLIVFRVEVFYLLKHLLGI